ncbi:unnamed protein product [Symbiodinium sp. CCMP2456]|nr:unnamed protein product [Symbiodinium sp. CCMP2456]
MKVLASRRLPLYQFPPQAIIEEAELQDLGRARLSHLAAVQRSAVGAGGDSAPDAGDWRPSSSSNAEPCELDAVSHFVVRLLCCGDTAARSWFLAAEESLFLRRWAQVPWAAKLSALRRVGMEPDVEQGTVTMHFSQLPPVLLAQRRCRLCRGTASVHAEDFAEVVVHRFRKHLTAMLDQAVASAAHLHPSLQRTVDALRPALEEVLVGFDSSTRFGDEPIGLCLANFEQMLRESFPPCMQYLVDFQRRGKHLKHHGRIQLRPLLREAGLPLPEAVRWWRREFLRDPDVREEAFNLEHAVHIQHAYGQMGKRKPAYGWSCRKALDPKVFPAVDAKRAHGCPFRSLDEEELRRLLVDFTLSPASAAMASALARGQVDESSLGLPEFPTEVRQEEKACLFVFRERHPTAELPTALGHPMEFLRRSRRYFKKPDAGMQNASAEQRSEASAASVLRDRPEVPLPRQPARPAYKKPLRVASGLGKLFDEHFRQLHRHGGTRRMFSAEDAMFWRLAILAVGAGLLFGAAWLHRVDLASIGAAVESMSEELQLDREETEWVVSGAKGGAIFGSLFGGALIMSRGRRTIIGWSAIPSMIGPALVFTAHSLPQLIAGRFLMGIGIGLASVATPSYLSEVVLPEQRGLFEAMYELGIASGMLLSALANALLQMLDSDAVWRYQAGCVPFVFACPVLLVVWTVPESPRWMLQTVGSSPSSLLAVLEEISSLRRPGARKRLETWRSGRGSLEELYELSSDADTAEGQDDLIRLWDDKHLAAGSPLYRSDSKLEEKDEAVRLRTLPILQRTLKDVCAIIVGSQQVPAGARRGLALALAAAVLNQACASTSILIYAEKMLASVGFGQENQDLLTLMVIGAKMLGVILGLAIVERVSRRTLLGAGGGLSAVALLVIALGAAWGSPALLVSGMSCFIAIFCSTWGIGYWIVVVEVTAAGGPRYSSATQSVATATLFAAGWLTSLTFMDVISHGPAGLLMYASVAALMSIYGFCILPETGGHSLEECAGDIGSEASTDVDESESDGDSASSFLKE